MAKAAAPLSHRGYLTIDKNYEAAAAAADLIYITDQQPGIFRAKKNKGFAYHLEKKVIRDKMELERIKKLAIPPAWTKVWICRSRNGHIQATGYDKLGRKQYRYHPKWHAFQNETKFHRMFEFGKALPVLRRQIAKDLAQPGFPETKVMAMLVSLLERTYIRVGNEDYEKLYGSYGLTTMKNKHVNVHGDAITFSFKGKKGVYHEITLHDKRFARIIKQCRAIPGRELFQYCDSSGEFKKVDSGQVKQYIRDCVSMDFTTKDFRTWAGTLTMMQFLRAAEPCAKPSDLQSNLQEAYPHVSEKLGNTVAVCKKYYVHPQIANFYMADQLSRFFGRASHKKERRWGLSIDEQGLMIILRAIQNEQMHPKLTVRLLKGSLRKAAQQSTRRVQAMARPRRVHATP